MNFDSRNHLQLGQVVISKAGHDKGRAYAVVLLLEIKGVARVYVADGERHTSTKPKPKNPIHLQKTNTVDAGLKRVLDGGFAPSDAEIKKALEQYMSGF